MTKEKLKQIKLFHNLSDESLQKILDISTTKKLSKDNILFYEGEMPHCFYVLLEGRIKIYKHDFKGTELILHYFIKPILMAEMPSFENIAFPATAVATEDKTEVLLIDRKKFIELTHTEKELSFCIIKSLSEKIKQLEVTINRNLIYDAMSKVCSFILENPSELVEHKHKKTAIILNMAPETLSRVLTKLKKMEILDRECKLLDREKLGMFLDF